MGTKYTKDGKEDLSSVFPFVISLALAPRANVVYVVVEKGFPVKTVEPELHAQSLIVPGSMPALIIRDSHDWEATFPSLPNRSRRS